MNMLTSKNEGKYKQLEHCTVKNFHPSWKTDWFCSPSLCGYKIILMNLTHQSASIYNTTVTMKGYQLPHKDWNCMHTGTNWWRINTTVAEWQGGRIEADYKKFDTIWGRAFTGHHYSAIFSGLVVKYCPKKMPHISECKSLQLKHQGFMIICKKSRMWDGDDDDVDNWYDRRLCRQGTGSSHHSLSSPSTFMTLFHPCASDLWQGKQWNYFSLTNQDSTWLLYFGLYVCTKSQRAIGWW